MPRPETTEDKARAFEQIALLEEDIAGAAALFLTDAARSHGLRTRARVGRQLRLVRDIIAGKVELEPIGSP